MDHAGGMMVIYAPRREVIEELFALMRARLCRRDCRLLLAHCGYFGDTPYTSRQLAAHFGLKSAEEAEDCVRWAIAVLRAAIPGSPLAKCVRLVPATFFTEDTAG